MFDILKINKEAEKIKKCIRFDKGSADFVFPEEFCAIAQNTLDNMEKGHLHYPEMGGEIDLKKEISFFEQKMNGRDIDESDIIITHGGMSGLFYSFHSLFKTGDEILMNQFSFEGFSLLCKHFLLKEKRIDLKNIEKYSALISKKTKAVIFNSPENPTGKLYSGSEVKNIVKFCRKNKLILISDEVTNQIIYSGNKFCAPTPKKNVIIINSFSKNWFLPGVRAGWIACKDNVIKNKIEDSISLECVGVNLFVQKLMKEILAKVDYQKFIKKRLAILQKRRNFVIKYLCENKIEFISEVRGGTVFYINTKKDSRKIFNTLLYKYKTAVIPGDVFEGKKSTRIRIGFGSVEEKEILEGLRNIKKVIEQK